MGLTIAARVFGWTSLGRSHALPGRATRGRSLRYQQIVGFTVVFLASVVSSAWPQALTGNVVGSVVDSSGARLPGVALTLKSASIMGSQEAITSETGDFRFPALPPGTYVVTAVLAGFDSVERTGVIVSVGGTTRLELTLQVAALAESVTVSAASPVVDVDSARVSTNFTQQALQEIPLERDFYAVLKATPGVVNDSVTYRATSSISGAGVRNTGYAMDGVNVTDPSAAYVGVRHFNFDTLDEVEIITGSMPAEIGSVSGGFVNIVTKSGGNDFRGAASYYYSEKSLQSGLSSEAIANGVRPGGSGINRLSDATVELGGRIKRDKAWFYGSYRNLKSDTLFIGFRFEPWVIPENSPIGFLKVSLQPTPSHKFMVSWNQLNRHQPYFVSFDGGPLRAREATWSLVDTGPWYGAQYQWIATPRTFVETRFGAWDKVSEFDFQPTTVGPATFDLSTNENTGAHVRGQRDKRHRYQVSGSVSHFKESFLGGSHDFKAGVDWAYVDTDGDDRDTMGYVRQFTAGVPTFVVFNNGYPDPIRRVRVIHDYGVYAQDRWSISKRLHVESRGAFRFRGYFLSSSELSGHWAVSGTAECADLPAEEHSADYPDRLEGLFAPDGRDVRPDW